MLSLSVKKRIKKIRKKKVINLKELQKYKPRTM